MEVTKRSKLFLYVEQSRGLRSEELADFVEAKFPWVDVTLRSEFCRHLSAADGQRPGELITAMARGWAEAKVRQLGVDERTSPLDGEVRYEERRLNEGLTSWGLVYRADDLMRLFWGLLSADERQPECLHVVLTNQLIGTWGDDRRLHLRTVFLGAPCIISISGLVEAPARPPDYYVQRQLEVQLTGEARPGELAEGNWLRHEDDRKTEVAKGYVAQAIMYHFFGEPWCDDPGCRLFNAHRQQEMLRAQLETEHGFCARHEEMARNG